MNNLKAKIVPPITNQKVHVFLVFFDFYLFLPIKPINFTFAVCNIDGGRMYFEINDQLLLGKSGFNAIAARRRYPLLRERERELKQHLNCVQAGWIFINLNG